MTRPDPFARFAPPVAPATPLRAAITAAYRRDEAACVLPLLHAATLPPADRERIAATARALVSGLRAAGRSGGVDELLREYALSSDEGVALLCLAEALLRIPDRATRDALIRDKIAAGDWRSHLSGEKALFVNAATWGLVVTRRLTTARDERGLSTALARVIGRVGEPIIRRAVEIAIRLMGERFVTGETIAAALKRARALETKGFRYSYDMLGEAAATAENAERFRRDYEAAIHAIGNASDGRGVYDGPGISIKLSALHPRYSRAQVDRVMGELLPRVRDLALLARRYDIGFNIDAEEADRLELSLDLLEALALDPDLAGWQGLGFVAQAYGKRCPFLIDWIIDLARRADRRIMVRLVKGAYWDAEIKRAQVDGLAGFAVYTRKTHTDVAYIACARKLLAAPDAVFPQFATHNAQTVATIFHLAGPGFATGDYEFQCLHGMGEALYEQVLGVDRLDRPCRIYAPVGTHETLLAYFVRRLLENGANSSFVNRIADATVSLDELAADPVEQARAMATPGDGHDRILAPVLLYGDRPNSTGLDPSDESTLAALGDALRAGAATVRHAAPVVPGGAPPRASAPVRNPADRNDIVGTVASASEVDAARAVDVAAVAAAGWAATPAGTRADRLDAAADLMQAEMSSLLGILVREAGKSLPNAVAEVREAIDFLRYYAAGARAGLSAEHRPLGPVVCISPWNFPLAIFIGQIAAALAAGNPVIAKPAEETPLVAADAVRFLHRAGIPVDVLQFLPGDGAIGAALVAAPQVAGVIFTGSTEVARLIQCRLAGRLLPSGQPVPLVAETGGQNAMIVDSSALAEQVVADVIASAFDSAGQRCSALRVLCLQDEVADRILTMLKGALAELNIGRTDRLSADIGPVIADEARARIAGHVDRLRTLGCAIEEAALPNGAAAGSFVAPTIIEIDRLDMLDREVFGPILHVLRYRRQDLDALVDAINATGYGLTFGLHTRIGSTVEQVTRRIAAGNLYVNRNVIGAVVGVQPFGGHGLSGTGPKAGGPLYLSRLVAASPPAPLPRGEAPAALAEFAAWLDQCGDAAGATRARIYAAATALGGTIALSGPVGESNVYRLHARGRVLAHASTPAGRIEQIAAILATGNRGVIAGEPLPGGLPAGIAASFDADGAAPMAAALVEGDAETVAAVARRVATLPGAIVSVYAADPAPPLAYNPDWLLSEVVTSIDTTAAGGNASLMAIG